MISNAPVKLDLAAVRSRLAGADAPEYWRSLEEAAGSKQFQDYLHREFPAQASEWTDEVSRRNFLKLMGASLALAGVVGCTRQPAQEIIPYVKQPENLVPGKPLFFATAYEHDGFATGLLVESHEGHPTKIEGNPEHPASLGSAGIFEQASLLDLYNPARSQAILNGGEISTWEQFLAAINVAMAEQKDKQGAGLRILTETITSPTLSAQLQVILKNYPLARWCQFQSISRDNIREGAKLAFGQIVETQYHFEQAKIIVSLDSDFLFRHPERLRYARAFADGRRLTAGQREMNRLYVAESSATITGSMADHRLPIESSRIENLAHALAEAIAHGLPATQNSANGQNAWLAAVVADLQNNRGAGIVIAGEQQPPVVHALVHQINQTLGNIGKPITYTASAEANPINQLDSFRQLAEEMEAGKVDLLLILGGNPAFTAPIDLNFADRLAKVKRSVHVGLEQDETATLCQWHVPQTHFLEAWSDTRAFDGTISIVQPLIQPSYENHSAHEILEAMQQQPVSPGYDIIRAYWREKNLWPDFEKSWRRSVHDGVIAETSLPTVDVSLKPDWAIGITNGGTKSPASPEENSTLEISFSPDPTIWDGRFASNGWLQELSKPLSKLTWDNAALISPALAQKKNLANGNVVELRYAGRSLKAPIFIVPGQAERTVTVYLGHGRSAAGNPDDTTGFNANRLRNSKTLWFGWGLELIPTRENYPLATTQQQHAVEGRDILFTGQLSELLREPDLISKKIEHEDAKNPGRDETLYNPREHDYDGYRWGMSIDLNVCTGCNACVVACQSENNIPVVGKKEVERGRHMLWIRIDSYFRGGLDNPEVNHMPVPCMHCENAPCELVCPVGATVHDHEGLNLMVYNRCVGTRYCSNNCPYKVRRFNFLAYADYRTPSLKPMRNPNVTVRSRGVMEKCTYCIQRISAARIESEEKNVYIKDGDVVTACQQACPTRAIVFGNIADPNSQVSRIKAQSLDYKMLGVLNTRPRTTYEAKIRNPNPTLETHG